MGIIIGILMFMILVIIHEWGHFSAAKRAKVKVLEFGVGIPPKIKKLRKDKSGTEYTLNAIPLGWFVRLKGENPNNKQDFEAKDSFASTSISKKIIILLGGVAMNILTAYIIFVYLFTSGTKPLIIIPDNTLPIISESMIMPSMSTIQAKWLLSGEVKAEPVIIQTIIPESLASTIDLQTGDLILAINQQQIDSDNISTILQQAIGQNIALIIQRNNRTFTINTQCPPDSCLLWIIIQSTNQREILPYTLSFGQALKQAGYEIIAQGKLTRYGLTSLGKQLLSFDAQEVNDGISKLSGPVGAIKIGNDIRQVAGRKWFLAFAAMISLALAFFNILPIPALDGWRILGVIIQAITKAKPQQYFIIESYINAFFFIILMALGIYIIFQDLVNIRGL